MHLEPAKGALSFDRKRKHDFLFIISYHKCSPLKMSKSRKKTKEKLKENLKPTHPYQKAPFSGVRPHKYATVSFSTKSAMESVSKSCVFGIIFIVYVWTITVSITKKLRFRVDGV